MGPGTIPCGHLRPCHGALPRCCQATALSNRHRLPCFVSRRIVKMSSPNLNVVTLLGSGLTYTSAYLFGIQEQSLQSRHSVETLIQVSGARLCLNTHVRVWTRVGATGASPPGLLTPSAPISTSSRRCGSACCAWGPPWCWALSWGRAGGSTRCSPSGCRTSGW